jgi:hypothetical protein
MAEREQLSVPIEPALREEIAHVARREERTVAGQVRLWIAEGLAAERDRQQQERAA